MKPDQKITKPAVAVLLAGLVLAGGCAEKRTTDHPALLLNAVAGSVAQAGGRIVYSCWDTSVQVYDIAAQATVFTKRTGAICYARPLLQGDRLYFPLSNDTFICVQPATGAVVWKVGIRGRCSHFDLINDTTILASVKHYGLVAMNIENGKTLYELRYNYAGSGLPDVSPWPVAYDDQRFYVSNWQGNVVSAFDQKDGRLHWQVRDGVVGASGRCFVRGDRLFVGVNQSYAGGKILILAAGDGRVVEQVDCTYEENEEPVAYGSSVYFYSFGGLLNRYDWVTKRVDTIVKFEKKFDLSGNQMYLAGDKIYFSDASFYVNAYSIKENSFSRLGQSDRSLIGAFEFEGKTYFIY